MKIYLSIIKTSPVCWFASLHLTHAAPLMDVKMKKADGWFAAALIFRM